jgi:rhodanese-related sulfurtransferase
MDDPVKSSKDLVSEANQQIETLSAEEAMKLTSDANIAFVDLREPGEVEKGSLPGAVHVPRGLLEFQIDPQSPSHNSKLSGKKMLVLYCGSGGRSALAAKTLMDMGLTNVAHVAGGFPALQKARET